MIKICDLLEIIENGKFSIDLVKMCLTEERSFKRINISETNMDELINVYEKANQILDRYNKLRTFLEEKLEIKWKTSNYYIQWKETEQIFSELCQNLKNRKKTFQIYSIQLVNDIIKQDIFIEQIEFIQDVDLKNEDKNHICEFSDQSYELDEDNFYDVEQNFEEIQQQEEGNQNQEQFETLQKEKEIEVIVKDSEEEDEKKERKEIKNEQQLQDQINKTQEDNDILNNHKETIQKKQKVDENNYILINQQIHDISSDTISSCERDYQTEHAISCNYFFFYFLKLPIYLIKKDSSLQIYLNNQDYTPLFYSTILDIDEFQETELTTIQDKLDLLKYTAEILNININIKVLDVQIDINPECYCYDVDYEYEGVDIYGFSKKVKIDMMNIKETDYGYINFNTNILANIKNINYGNFLDSSFITFINTPNLLDYSAGQITSQLLVLSHFQEDFNVDYLNGFFDKENRLTIISDLNSIAISKSNYLLFVQNLKSITSLSLIIMQKVNLQKELLGNLKAYVYDLFDI